jgi:hypothetical protein
MDSYYECLNFSESDSKKRHDWSSVSPSFRRAPSGSHDRILMIARATATVLSTTFSSTALTQQCLGRKLSNQETVHVHLFITILTTKWISPQRTLRWKVGYFNGYPGKRKQLKKKFAAVKSKDGTVRKGLHTQNDKQQAEWRRGIRDNYINILGNYTIKHTNTRAAEQVNPNKETSKNVIWITGRRPKQNTEILTKF